MLKIKDYLPKKLFARGVVLIAAPIFLLQIAVISLILERYWDRITERLSYISSKEIASIIAQPNAQQRQKLAKQLNFKVTFTQASLPAERKVLFTDFLYHTLRRNLEKFISYPIWINTQNLKGHIDIRIAHQGGVLRFIVPRHRVYAQKTYQLIIWISVFGIVVLAIAILFLRNQVRPIQRLAVAAKHFGRGLDVENFQVTGAFEVREAGQAFLDMRDNLRSYMTQRTNMLNAISHDMRTALTRLRLQIALLPESTETEALTDDVKNMELMLNDYLSFARGERQEEKPITLDLKQMLVDMIQPLKKNIALNITQPLLIRLRPQAIRRCLSNLISNATTYGKHVAISAHRDKNGITVLIDDDGPGIDEKHYEEAFRPFHRLDEARNQNITGTGLGLAISRDIVLAIGGDITLHQSPQGGLRTKLFLPS